MKCNGNGKYVSLVFLRFLAIAIFLIAQTLRITFREGVNTIYRFGLSLLSQGITLTLQNVKQLVAIRIKNQVAYAKTVYMEVSTTCHEPSLKFEVVVSIILNYNILLLFFQQYFVTTKDYYFSHNFIFLNKYLKIINHEKRINVVIFELEWV